MKSALLLSLVLAPLPPALAQDAQNGKRLPEELAITRSIVMQHADELESSAICQFFKLSDQKNITATAEFEYGVTDRWELDADVPYEFINPKNGRSVDGIGDVEAAVRYGVVPLGEKPFAFNVGLGFGIPTGDHTRDLGDGRLTLEPSFTASTWLGGFNTQLNCGWQRAITNGGEEPRDDFTYNVAVLWPISRWFLVLEGNGESNHDRTTYSVTPELIWKPTRSLQFLIATPVGVTHAAADYGIIASVTLEWEGITGRGPDRD